MYFRIVLILYFKWNTVSHIDVQTMTEVMGCPNTIEAMLYLRSMSFRAPDSGGHVGKSPRVAEDLQF